MITVPIFVMLFFVFWILNTNSFKKNLNYANLFLTLWCVIPAVSAFGLYDFFVPPVQTYLYIILMIIIFECGTLFFKHVKMGKKEVSLYTIEDINWTWMLIISIVCLIVIFPFFLISIKYALTNGYYYLRLQILNNGIIGAKNQVIIQNIIQPLIIITTMISLYELVENRKFKRVTFVSILNCGIYMLTLGNRWLLMEVLYLIIVFLISKYSLNIIAIIKKNKWVIRIGVILVIGMLFITTQRSIRGSTGIIYDVYTYFVGSIHLFGVAIGDPITFALDSSNYLFGKEFFSAIIGLMNNIFAFLGLDNIMQSGMSIVNEVTQKYYFVSSSTHMNNNITMVYGFMRDAGVLGIVIDSILLSLIYAKLFRSREKSLYHKMMYYFAVTMIPHLIFEWIYGRTFILIVFLILMILAKLDKKTKRRVAK